MKTTKISKTGATTAATIASTAATTTTASTAASTAATTTTANNTAAVNTANTAAANESTTAATTKFSSKLSLIARKKMLYQKTDDEAHSKSDSSKRPKIQRTADDSSIEILNGTFSNLKPLVASAKGRAQSTPQHRIELKSGNTSHYIQPSSRPGANIRESTDMINHFVQSLCSRRVRDMQAELNDSENHFGSMRDRVEEVFDEMKAAYQRKLLLLQENRQAIKAGIDRLTEQLERRDRSISDLEDNINVYDKFYDNFLSRLPSAKNKRRVVPSCSLDDDPSLNLTIKPGDFDSDSDFEDP